MTQPLALVFYEKLLPGTQILNRLQDIGYRVQAVNDFDSFVLRANQDKPMLAIADLNSTRSNVPMAIRSLRQNPATTHLPIIGFCDDKHVKLQEEARNAGATLVVNDSTILNHLQQFLDQALHID
jgi:CheY-like chemotaxis protein